MAYTQKNYDDGIYVLQIYARAHEIDAPTVIQNYKRTYGENEIRALGVMFQGVSGGVLRDKLLDLDGSVNPKRVDLQDALIQSGGNVSLVKAIKEGVAETASQAASVATSGLKWVLILGGLGLAAYLAVQFGVFKKIAGKA